MARCGGCRMLRAGCHRRHRRKSPYNECHFECTQSPNTLCSRSNLTSTRAADRTSRRPLPGSAGPPTKEIRLSLVMFAVRILTIFLCTLYTILTKFFVTFSRVHRCLNSCLCLRWFITRTVIGPRQRIFRRRNVGSGLCWCDCRCFPDRHCICACMREVEVRKGFA